MIEYPDQSPPPPRERRVYAPEKWNMIDAFLALPYGLPLLLTLIGLGIWVGLCWLADLASR